jgi:hypothetical protein
MAHNGVHSVAFGKGLVAGIVTNGKQPHQREARKKPTGDVSRDLPEQVLPLGKLQLGQDRRTQGQ